MASFVNKALAYLGLKDLDDDELYEDDYDGPDEPLGGRSHTVYPEREYEEPLAEPRSFGGTIRPISPGDDAGRTAVVRPLVPNRMTTAKVHIVAPERFSEAQ